MMHEDFERAHLIDAAIMTADLMEEIYRAEMDEDLKDYFGKDAKEDKIADCFVVHFSGHGYQGGADVAGDWALH